MKARRRPEPAGCSASSVALDRQDVVLEHGAHVVARVPPDDRRHGRHEPAQRRLREADGVAAVHESPATLAETGVAMGGGQVLREPHERGRVGDRVAERVAAAGSDRPSVVVVGQRLQVPPVRGVREVGREIERRGGGPEVVVEAGFGALVAEGEQRAPLEVGDEFARIGHRAHAEQHQPASRLVGLAGGLAHRRGPRRWSAASPRRGRHGAARRRGRRGSR